MDKHQMKKRLKGKHNRFHNIYGARKISFLLPKNSIELNSNLFLQNYAIAKMKNKVMQGSIPVLTQ